MQRRAPILVRRRNEIYFVDRGWFKGHWHFSFDEYFDPANMGIGKLRVFNHDVLAPGAAWPMHRHRDVEAITYVVAGVFEHADSLGNNGILSAGSVQRITLGAGAMHSERNHSRTAPLEFIQMWILPNKKGLLPALEQRTFDLEDRRNRLLQIAHAESQSGGGVMVHQDASVFVSHLDAPRQVEHAIRDGHVGYFYVIDGSVSLNGQELDRGDAAKILSTGCLDVIASSDSEVLLVEVAL